MTFHYKMVCVARGQLQVLALICRIGERKFIIIILAREWIIFYDATTCFYSLRTFFLLLETLLHSINIRFPTDALRIMKFTFLTFPGSDVQLLE